MKFTANIKNAIRQYVLQKISEGCNGLSSHVADTFGIGTTTVHAYLNELIEEGVIKKNGRDRYSLVTEKYVFSFARSKAEIEDEGTILDCSLLPLISDLPGNVRNIWTYAFSEMVNNVIDHSGAERLFISISQSDLKTDVAIMDDGVGVFRKIKDHFGYASLDDAIIELSKGKLTTDRTRHSGEGIFFTSRIMDEFILCSDKKVFTFNKYEEEMLTDIGKEFAFSTCVFLSLSNSSNKQLKEIFDRYADVDEGFVKTRIPMKNVFDTAPISRSQAKRVCSRLDQFREVELDFEGIDFMGQGFADEVFRVFRNAHPEIRIIPLNMQEDVEKMYRHVLSDK